MMPERKARRRVTRNQTEDGIKEPNPGEIANLLHVDMMAHRKRTVEFNNSWKRALCYASVGLAVVSLLKAVEKAREENSGWTERGLTAANAGLIALWVANVDGQGSNVFKRPTQIAAVALSLYQLLAWWTSRYGGEHVDFPVAVILLVVAVVSIASMKSTLKSADSAFQASGNLADKVSARRQAR